MAVDVESIKNISNGDSSPFIVFFPAFDKRYVSRLLESSYDHIAKKFARFQYAVMFGVIDPQEIHNGLNSNLSYTDLFHHLIEKGYDPLLPIRNKDGKIEKQLARVILNGLKVDTSTYEARERKRRIPNIREKVQTWAKSVVEFIQDYLYGLNLSKGWPLADSTMRNREYNINNDSRLYKAGIDEQLVETGLLYKSIRYKIIPIYQYYGESLQSHRRKLSESAKKRTYKDDEGVSTTAHKTTKREANAYRKQQEKIKQEGIEKAEFAKEFAKKIKTAKSSDEFTKLEIKILNDLLSRWSHLQQSHDRAIVTSEGERYWETEMRKLKSELKTYDFDPEKNYDWWD